MTNERRYPRFEVELAAEVQTLGDVLLAATRNLSRGGVCLDVEQPLPERADLAVSLFLTLEGIEEADGETVNLKASVVWCGERDSGGYTAGLKFGPMSPHEMATIERILNRLG